MADIAQVAMARGFFRQHDSDQLGLNQGQEEFDRLESFLDALDRRGTMESPMPPRSPLKAAFAAWFKLGVTTFENGDSPAFQGYLRALDFDPNSTQTWPLKLALCQGLLQSEPSQDVIDHSFGILQPHLISRFEDAAANNGQALVDKILEYALAAGLSHVVIAAPLNVEFKRDDGSANGFRRTASVVAARSDSKGRPRIDLPFRLAGHIICPEPTRLDGLAWCIDALRAGYTVAHVPLAEHDRMRSLSRIVARHCHDRFVASRLAQSRLLRRLWSRRSAANSTRLDPALSSMVLKRSPTYEVADRRILMVAQDLGRGGSERQMVALVQGLVRRRFDVRILALDRIKPDKPGYAADIELLGVAVDYAEDMTNDAPTDRLAVSYPAIPAGLPSWLTDRVAPIQRAIIKHRPAVLHGRQDATGIATGMAGCLLGVPRTIVQQGSMAIVRRAHPASEPMRRAYQALATNPSIKILNNSKAGARDNEAWIGLPSDSIGLIYNGFVPGSARLPAETEVIDLRRSMGLADTDLVVGTVMRFVKEKDPDLWIDTAAAIVAGLPDVKFLIFGYGPFESAMRDKIKRLGLRDQVVMAGATTDVGLAFSAMDVVLLTSVIEGLPNVMIEAQAVGRSVVAPDVGGTREALVEGVTGRIASKRTAQQLAWAVIEILKDEPGRRRVLSAGPHLVAGRFDLDDMIETTLRYYGLAS
jgi:glycosyltransferase involved in cell wall biosynthesis